mgnify:CR=1 FL=1
MQRQITFGGGVSPRGTLLRGQGIIEYVLIIAVIGLAVIFTGPQVSGAIRNQLNQVTNTLDDGTVGENFYDVTELPDPENGTAFAIYSEDDHSLMFYKRRGVPKVGDMFNDRRVTAVYTDFEESTPPSTGDTRYESGAWHEYKQSVKTISVVDEGIRPKSIARWFGNFTALQSFDIEKLDMSLCIGAYYLFVGCTSLKTADLSGWDTPMLNSAGGIFEKCANLESVNLNGWTAPNLTDCWYMFQQTALKSVDLSGVNFGTIRLINGMFGYNFQLESIEFGSKFDLSAAYDLTEMFDQCRSLHLDCSDWNVSPNTLHGDFNENAPGVTLPKDWR